MLSSFFSGSGGGGGGGGGGGADRLGAEKKPITYPFFFFFGKPAFTTTLPAQLALKYNLSIVRVYIKRVGKNKYLCVESYRTE